jgi:hypothetical protein
MIASRIALRGLLCTADIANLAASQSQIRSRASLPRFARPIAGSRQPCGEQAFGAFSGSTRHAGCLAPGGGIFLRDA